MASRAGSRDNTKAGAMPAALRHRPRAAVPSKRCAFQAPAWDRLHVRWLINCSLMDGITGVTEQLCRCCAIVQLLAINRATSRSHCRVINLSVHQSSGIHRIEGIGCSGLLTVRSPLRLAIGLLQDAGRRGSPPVLRQLHHVDHAHAVIANARPGRHLATACIISHHLCK